MGTQVRDLENYNDFNILVTGGSGQIGSDLKFRKENNNLKFFFPSSKELNLLEFDTIERYLDSNDFHLILNLAAFTDVDKSETHKEKANKINNLAVKKIADAKIKILETIEEKLTEKVKKSKYGKIFLDLVENRKEKDSTSSN